METVGINKYRSTERADNRSKRAKRASREKEEITEERQERIKSERAPEQTGQNLDEVA